MHYQNMPIQEYWKFHHQKLKVFRYSDIFHISAQNMFLKRNKKNNVYPCKPQFNYIKVGFKGVKII